jgi:integrase
MTRKSKSETAPKHHSSATSASITLVTVLTALEGNTKIAPTRLRDLRSAVKRVAALLGNEPPAVQLDMGEISTRMAAVNPVTAGMTAKRLANIRSDFLGALKVSGLKTSIRRIINPEWRELLGRLQGRRAHIGLSRLAGYASQEGIAPEDVNDQVIDRFIAAVREGSLHRQPNTLHRQVTLIWNEAAKDPALGMQPVAVPSFRGPPKRIPWDLLTERFRQDVEEHLSWCAVSDPFAEHTRARPLAPRTVRLRRNQIHAAVTSLMEAGTEPSAITSLADLVSPENMKRILRQRLAAAGGGVNAFNRDLAEALVQISREWVKPGPEAVAELRRLAGRMPLPVPGLTSKNKAAMRQFDDPAVFHRLIDLPRRLWAEVRRDAKPNFRTLAKAQAVLGIAILSYLPIRPGNLSDLAFGIHLFLEEGRGAISTMELAPGEVKNDQDLGFDIPPSVAKLLIEYRDRIAPKVIGRRPERVFVHPDGTAKSQVTVAYLIKAYLKRRAGVVLTPHQFRHLGAKVILDEEPGNFETVTQLLGHKNRKTTADFYAGISTRRAARHHQNLIERALEARAPRNRRGRKAS